MAEMASSVEVAQARFALLHRELGDVDFFHIPCCGMGGDAIALLELLSPEKREKVFLSDISPLSCAMANYNVRLQNQTPQVICMDFRRDCLLPGKVNSYCFFDPSRRISGSRHLSGQYEPDLRSCLPILNKYSLSQIKLAPGEDLAEVSDLLANYDFAAIEHERELKELCATRSSTTEENLCQQNRVAIRLRSGKTPAVWSHSERAAKIPEMAIPNTGFLMLPCKSLVKIRRDEVWAQNLGLDCIAESIYTSPQSMADPMCDTFRILGVEQERPRNLVRRLRSISTDYQIELKIHRCRPSDATRKAIAPFMKGKAGAPLLTLLPVQKGLSRQMLLLERCEGG
ncbi:MAG: hypothetical protein HQL31_00870 [Planctomycetes bacterium]|nr:hypothetical protein [Planctomycetota bacterium]